MQASRQSELIMSHDSSMRLSVAAECLNSYSPNPEILPVSPTRVGTGTLRERVLVRLRPEICHRQRG